LKKQLLLVALSTLSVTACGGSNSSSVSDEAAQTGIVNDADSGDSVQTGIANENDSDESAQTGIVNETDSGETGSNADATDSTDSDTADSTDSDSTDSADNSDNINNNDEGGNDTAVLTPPPQGLLATAQPTFTWPAVANAEEYKIVVNDAGGSGYARSLDPLTANCQTGEGTCSATTNLAYYDNDLTWQVESTVNGEAGPVSDSYSITTPLSENMQPIKSNDGGCEAWAAVAYGKYVVLNNSWNSRSINDPNWFQSINVTENANGTISPMWTYDWRGQFDGDEIAVKAYPEVLYGPKLGTHVSGTKEETGLPEQVSQLPEFVVSYDYSETGNAERNVALESFFHDSDDIRGPCDDDDNRVYEMMIWVNNPSIRTPGKLALTGVMVDNQLWNVYIKPDSNKHYIAFTAQNPTTSGTLNWKRFVDWTRDWTAANAEERRIDVLDPGFYMGAIEIGTEMWWGEGTFTLNRFEVTF